MLTQKHERISLIIKLLSYLHAKEVPKILQASDLCDALLHKSARFPFLSTIIVSVCIGTSLMLLALMVQLLCCFCRVGALLRVGMGANNSADCLVFRFRLSFFFPSLPLTFFFSASASAFLGWLPLSHK
jgi:hypothetical protein